MWRKQNMPTARSLVAALALAFTAISCSDKGPTTPSNSGDNSNPINAARAPAGLTQAVTGVLSDGGTFAGTLSIAQITRDATTGALLAAGTLTGTATQLINGQTVTTSISQTFANVPLSLTQASQPCRILHLDLGPIHLDLLGLNVDLSQVVLDITAQPGPGNLLGNLLCAVAHLLDQNPLSAAITNLLNQINAILGGL
jgi:hypothetical protein